MGTHDEETRKFFKHSSVICVLSPRYASNKLSIFKQQACFWAGVNSLHISPLTKMQFCPRLLCILIVNILVTLDDINFLARRLLELCLRTIKNVFWLIHMPGEISGKLQLSLGV